MYSVNISVSKRKGRVPVLLIYDKKESTSTCISNSTYKRFIQGNHKVKMEIVKDALEDIFNII